MRWPSVSCWPASVGLSTAERRNSRICLAVISAHLPAACPRSFGWPIYDRCSGLVWSRCPTEKDLSDVQRSMFVRRRPLRESRASMSVSIVFYVFGRRLESYVVYVTGMRLQLRNKHGIARYLTHK